MSAPAGTLINRIKMDSRKTVKSLLPLNDRRAETTLLN